MDSKEQLVKGGFSVNMMNSVTVLRGCYRVLMKNEKSYDSCNQ